MPGLKPLIIQEIEQSGPMPVDRYMELCLSHPVHGYYMKKDPFGVNGDFTTAPEISQIFGEMIAVWLINRWQELDSPEEFALIELGPGRGTLMADILRTVKIVPEFLPEVHLVEISSVLKTIQQKKLDPRVKPEDDMGGLSSSGLTRGSIFWHAAIPNLDIPSIIIANEFFDALPIKQFVGGRERKILVDDSRLAFDMVAEDGLTSEICEAGLEIMDRVSSQCEAGIIIDYGYIDGEKKDTLQALRNHKYVSALEEPGNADITAHVDFEKLGEASQKPCIITTQKEFLLQHGAEIRAKKLGKEEDLKRLVDVDQMGELFKVLCF